MKIRDLGNRIFKNDLKKYLNKEFNIDIKDDYIERIQEYMRISLKKSKENNKNIKIYIEEQLKINKEYGIDKIEITKSNIKRLEEIYLKAGNKLSLFYQDYIISKTQTIIN